MPTEGVCLSTYDPDCIFIQVGALLANDLSTGTPISEYGPKHKDRAYKSLSCVRYRLKIPNVVYIVKTALRLRTGNQERLFWTWKCSI